MKQRILLTKLQPPPVALHSFSSGLARLGRYTLKPATDMKALIEQVLQPLLAQPSAERLAALDAEPDGCFLRIHGRFFDIVGYS